MNIEWIAEDYCNTLGHVAKIEMDNIQSISPLQSLTKKDLEIASTVGVLDGLKRTNLIVAGENLEYSTFTGLGKNKGIMDSLLNRFMEKKIPDKINLVYSRIPHAYNLGETIIPVNGVTDVQASMLVGVQLEAKASAIIPPLNSGITSIDVFERVYDRTKIEIQTHRKEKEIIGYIPTTQELPLVSKMVEAYCKDGINFFAVDFSSSPLNRWLIRTVVTAIRQHLRIKGQVGEKKDKQYYLHVFNVAGNKKTPNPVAPITDILTHAYSVDSTTGVMWGGGKLVKDKLRYFNMNDYGAYHIGALDANGINYDKNLITGSTMGVYEKLRAHKLIMHKKECEIIANTIGEGNISGFAPHISSKSGVTKEVKNVLMDIREIQARSS